MSDKFLGFLAIMVLISAASKSVGADTNTTPRRLPPPAESVMTRMETEIIASKLRAMTALEKLLRDTTKKGDLEGAVAIKNAIERLKAETEGMKGEGAGSFVGKWKTNDSATTFEVYPDGRVVNDGGVKGRWTADGGLIEIQWENGLKVVIRPSENGFVGQRTAANGAQTAVIYLRVAVP